MFGGIPNFKVDAVTQIYVKKLNNDLHFLSLNIPSSELASLYIIHIWFNSRNSNICLGWFLSYLFQSFSLVVVMTAINNIGWFVDFKYILWTLIRELYKTLFFNKKYLFNYYRVDMIIYITKNVFEPVTAVILHLNWVEYNKLRRRFISSLEKSQLLSL